MTKLPVIPSRVARVAPSLRKVDKVVRTAPCLKEQEIGRSADAGPFNVARKQASSAYELAVCAERFRRVIACVAICETYHVIEYNWG